MTRAIVLSFLAAGQAVVVSIAFRHCGSLVLSVLRKCQG